MVDQQPVRSGQYRGIRGSGMAAAILIVVVVVLDIWSTWTTWQGYGVAQDYLAGNATENDLTNADDTISGVALGQVLAAIVAGIAVIAWLWQARVNAQLRLPAPHRRARAWVIWGWICPVVNFWFPYQIVDDVYRASRPDSPDDLDDLRTVPGSPLIGIWWAMWVAIIVLNRAIAYIWGNTASVEALRTSAILEILESAMLATAAGLFIAIIRRISAWQTPR